MPVRTVPFVAKATGVPLAKVAARVMVGATLAELRDEGLLRPPVDGGHVSVKEAVLPFNRFPDVDTAARPGDALDRRGDGHRRHLRAGVRQEPDRGGQPAAGVRLGVPLARRPRQGTAGSMAARAVRRAGLLPRRHRRHGARTSRRTACLSRPWWPRWGRAAARADRGRPHRQRARSQLVVNTPRGRGPRADGAYIRAGGQRAQRPVPHDRRRGARRRRRASPTGRRTASRCGACRSTTRGAISYGSRSDPLAPRRLARPARRLEDMA